MKNYFDRFDFGMSKFEFKDLLSDMKHSMDNMLFKKDKFDLGMEKFKLSEPLPNMKSGMDDTLFKKDNLDFGRDKLKFENPLLEMNRRMDFMNFRDRFKIDKPHPDILNNLDRPILKPDLREFNRTLEFKNNFGKGGKCPDCKKPLALSDSDFWYCRRCEWQEIPLSPKGKYNVMNAFHTFLDYSWRSKRIPEMPPFPKKSDYSLVEPLPEWVNSERLFKIIGFIPDEHRPVFLWMYYHLMRPAEACALQWDDWDEINQAFLVNRSISARKLVDSTKTSQIYLTPCHSDFFPYMKRLNKSDDRFKSPFIFKNPRARKKGRRYTNESLNVIWKAACEKAGETISLYGGMRHSRASQMYNELKMSIHEIKEAGTWKRLESVRRYAKTELTRKRELLEKKVIDIEERRAEK